MCGIFGILTKSQKKINDYSLEKLNSKLFCLAESRGKEAAGFAWITDKKITIVKQASKASELISANVYHNLWQKYENSTRGTLGHSRLATNGMLQDNHNNQPVYGNNSVVIHNGIVVNDEMIWKKNKNLKRQHEVDTEIITKLFELGLSRTKDGIKALQFVTNKLIGEASIAIASTHLNGILLYTNTGSIYYAYKKNNFFVFTSEYHSLNTFLRFFDLQLTVNKLDPNNFLMLEYGSLRLNFGKLEKKHLNHFSTLGKPWGRIVDQSAYPKPETSETSIHTIRRFSKLIEKYYSRNKIAVWKLKR